MIILMAWRNIWRNKMRSIIVMMSIAIGLFAGMAVLSLYKGMMKSRIATVVNAEIGHIQIHDTDFKKDYEPRFFIKNANTVLHEIQKIPEIKAIALRSITTGMLITPTGSAGVKINGIIPAQENGVSQLKLKIKKGKGFSEKKKNEVFIGKKLADKMKLKPGSKLVLTFTDTAGEIVSGAFRIAAIYQSDNAPLDERNVYVKIADLNELLGLTDQFHEIAIIIQDDKYLASVKKKLQQHLPQYQVDSWIDISPEMDLMVKTTDQYSYIIIVIIMIALAFGIINTMLMAILERTREIGMMIALGTSRIRVFMLILFETFFLTAAGTPIGIFLAWGIISYFNKRGLDLSGMGKEMMSSFGFNTLVYPEFPGEKLFGILVIVVSTAIISCLFPAARALKLKPADALRR
ncbi:MAG: ABC transporter permease [Bacteroidetes bacterium 43-93]|nr:ABC transporter permease [Bacteroidota bacterium]OJW97462.1 MAG: ABC transporter permease [Bacteroidetes bacterium 43-93]